MLSHHTFDSTHVAFGVVTVAVDRGRWTAEGSIFNGREPDEDRWDFDFGPLDSVSGRLWYRPTGEWELQISSGHLRSPEELGHGNILRTTASGSWFARTDDNRFSAVTVGYGRNDGEDGARSSLFAEGTRRSGANAFYGRFEAHQLETALLAPGLDHDRRDTVLAFTLGGVREVMKWGGFEGGIGAGATFHVPPDSLKSTHGTRPVSLQVFFRLRSPAPMGRMWNMHMTRPMTSTADPHAGHQMK